MILFYIVAIVATTTMQANIRCKRATRYLGPLDLKKLGRKGEDRPPGIILRRDRNIVPAEKIPKPCPPSLAGRHHPLCNTQPEGGAQDVTRELAGHNEGIFLNKPKIRSQEGSNSGPRGAT
jgi:hypothetical protein